MGKPRFEIGKIFDSSFEGMDRNELISNLQATATKIEDGVYTKQLTQDELGIAKSEFSDVSIKIAKIEENKKEAMEEFKQQLKQPKATAKELLETIKNQTVRKEGLLYLVDDQDAGVMYSFDEDAICVGFRPLSPKERQHSIMESQGVRKMKASNE
jgi:hypothetical protein